MDSPDQDILTRYHAQAKAALEAGTGTGQVSRRLQRLRAMPSALKATPEYCEAFVLTAVSNRVRPAAAHNHMGQLKKICTGLDDINRYVAFEDFLATHLNGLMFTPHGYTTKQLKDADADELYKGVHAQIAAIQATGYEVFANSGTLLGLIRDGAPIEHDDDIDLAVILKAKTHAEAGTEFRALVQVLRDAGIGCHLVEGHKPILKLEKVEGFEVDLFPAYGPDAGYCIYPYAFGDLSFADVYPLQTCQISGLPLPAKPEVLLEQNYGAGWRVPDPRFRFPWNRQVKKFAPLFVAIRD